VAAQTEGAIHQDGRVVSQKKFTNLARQDGDVIRLVAWLGTRIDGSVGDNNHEMNWTVGIAKRQASKQTPRRQNRYLR
jgi:hypothetical protein